MLHYSRLNYFSITELVLQHISRSNIATDDAIRCNLNLKKKDHANSINWKCSFACVFFFVVRLNACPRIPVAIYSHNTEVCQATFFGNQKGQIESETFPSSYLATLQEYRFSRSLYFPISLLTVFLHRTEIYMFFIQSVELDWSHNTFPRDYSKYSKNRKVQ